MTTKNDLHSLVERLGPSAPLDDMAAMLRQYTEEFAASEEPPYPRSVSMLCGAPTDLSANADDYLADGFGQ